MKNLRPIAEDDDNDSLLFERLQQNALLNHPNPLRIGCPGYDVLKAFVESPRTVDLRALNDLHIMQCSECTRELIELRQLRDAAAGKMQSASTSWTASALWKPVAIAAALCALIALALSGRELMIRSPHNNDVAKAVSLTVDLSRDGVSRSAEARKLGPVVKLPRKPLHLHIILPVLSPAGEYRVTIARDKGLHNVQAEAAGTATVNGPRTDLTVDLDLQRLAAGTYFLGAERIGDGGPYFYPIIVA